MIRSAYLNAIIFIFLTIFTGFLPSGISAQESINKTLGVGVFFPIALPQGINVYSQNHESYWTGIGIQGNIDITKYLYLGIDHSSVKSDVTDIHIINAQQTRWTHTSGQLGYRKSWEPSSVWITYLSGGVLDGNNQGSFKGYSYGAGLKWTKYFRYGLMVFMGSDWHKYNFDIKASPFWQPRFNQTSVVRFYLGGGIYLNQ